MSEDPVDREWRLAEKLVYEPNGVRTFRQFIMTRGANLHPKRPSEMVKFGPSFEDDFRLRSITERANWRPRGNRAICTETTPAHQPPVRNCTCGFYGSYSSSIIYEPDLLQNMHYCFAAVRQYGFQAVLSHNGLRSSGADVEAILFHPLNRKLPTLGKMMQRLEEEEIFYTFSARQFLRRVPDEDYSYLLDFDPVKRLAERKHLITGMRPFPDPRQRWVSVAYARKFCRPVQGEMLIQTELPSESGKYAFEVQLKPEYRPGGSLYIHPLLEVWGS